VRIFKDDDDSIEVFWNMDKYVPLFAVMLVFFASFSAAVNLTSVTVYKDSAFGVSNFVQTPDNIYPGDNVRLQFTVTNTGNSGYKNAAVNLLVPFNTVKSAYDLGTSYAGSSKQVEASFSVPASTKPGTYDIYIYSVADGAQSQVGKIPLVINSPDLTNALLASVSTQGDIISGSDTVMTVNLHNIANTDAEDVIVQVVVNSSGYLLPLYNDRAYIQSIPAGSDAQVSFDIAASASASPGYYPITLLISYKTDKETQPTISQTFGLPVDAQAAVLVTTDQDPVAMSANASSTLKFTIANAGGVAVRAVYAKATAENFAFTGADNEFIGTLNLDDTASLSLTLSPKGQLAAGEYPVMVNVSFKDAANTERYQLKTANVQYTSRAGSLTGTFGANGTRTGQRSGTIFGFDYMTIGAAIVILAIAGFFGYRYYQGRKKAPAAEGHRK